MLLLFKIPISTSSIKPLWDPVPRGSLHPHSYAKQVLHSECHFSSLQAWRQHAGSWRDTRAPQCPSTLQVAPFCQPCYPRIMPLWEVAQSVCLTYITAQAVSPVASLPCLVLPPHHCAKLSSSGHQFPSTSHELCDMFLLLPSSH